MNKKTLLLLTLLAGSSTVVVNADIESELAAEGLTPEQISEIMSNPEILEALQAAAAEESENLKEASEENIEEAREKLAIAEEAKEEAEEAAEEAVEQASDAAVLDEIAQG